jgi:hypothetical protein
MQGNGVRSSIKENVFATDPLFKLNKQTNKKPKCCWVCQQDKPTLGGHLKMMPGLMKFVCKDCCDKKKEANGKSNVES